MKRIYVVMGELEDTNQVDSYDGAYLSMSRADERCYELEAAPNNNHIWYWREVILEEGEEI